MTDERLKPGNCHKCGLPMSDNPHAEAGKPGHYLDVGCRHECIPCLVHSRHQWAGRAMKAENEVRDLQAARATAEQPDPIRALIAVHAEQLDQNDYAYFELAYTRHTAWMAWLCSNSRDDDPNRKVLAKGQGHTPEEACAAAIESSGGGS